MSLNEIFKKYRFTLAVSALTQEIQELPVTFYSYDVNTAKQEIVVNKDGQALPLTLASEVILVFKLNKAKVWVPIQIKDRVKGLLDFVIPDNLLGYSGEVLAGVFIRWNNGQSVDVGYFRFRMAKSLIDEDIEEIEGIYIPKFDELYERVMNQMDAIQERIEAGDFVSRNDYNQLPVRRRIQVTDWDALDNTVLGLRQGESAMVYANISALNSPWGGVNSVAGIAFLTASGQDNIAVEVYRSSNITLSDRKAMRFRGSSGWGEWKYGADTATRLQTPRTINDVAFDGTTNITVTADPTTTRIEANADLNSILTPGNYNNPLIVEATTIANTPLNEAFSLQVIRHGGNDRQACTQIFTNFQNQNSNFRRFIRNQNGAVWGPWFEIPLTVGTARTFDISVTRANQLSTARAITIGHASKTFDGSVNVSWSLSEIGISTEGDNQRGGSRIGNLIKNFGWIEVDDDGIFTVNFRIPYTTGAPSLILSSSHSTSWEMTSSTNTGFSIRALLFSNIRPVLISYQAEGI